MTKDTKENDSAPQFTEEEEYKATNSILEAYYETDKSVLARTLIKRYGNLYGLLTEAREDELVEKYGLDEGAAFFIKLLPCLAEEYLSEEQISDECNVFNRKQLTELLNKHFSEIDEEKCVLIFCDKNGRITEQLETGLSAKHEVVLSEDELVKLFNKHSGGGIVIAHNHIEGTLRPSKADKLTICKLNAIAGKAGISFFDSAIYARGKISLQSSGT